MIICIVSRYASICITPLLMPQKVTHPTFPLVLFFFFPKGAVAGNSCLQSVESAGEQQQLNAVLPNWVLEHHSLFRNVGKLN